MSGPRLELDFPCTWNAEILAQRPMILPRRQFVYPRQAEEVERGALEVIVQPGGSEPFLGTFALGFADPAAPTGIWSCPDPGWLCAVAGGYAYLVNTASPAEFEQVEYRPVLQVLPVQSHQLLIFAGHHSLLAWGARGKAWKTTRLSSEGIEIMRIDGNRLEGTGWDMRTDREVPFTIDLRTGAHDAHSGAFETIW